LDSFCGDAGELFGDCGLGDGDDDGVRSGAVFTNGIAVERKLGRAHDQGRVTAVLSAAALNGLANGEAAVAKQGHLSV